MGLHVAVAGGVARITLDNPPMNPIDAATHAALAGALDRLSADPGVRVLVLTGAGDQAFCAGADLKEVAALAPEAVAPFCRRWDHLYRAVREFPAPVIAAVNGYALGGGFEILLNCDLRVAADHARLGCTAANIGLVTSTHSLMRQLPPPLAREMFFTARHLTAAEALQWGLVNRVVPAAELGATTDALVAAVLARAPLALRRGKALMNQAPDLPREEHDQLHLQAFADLAATRDHREAVQAFLAKRPPRWRGQ